MCDKNCDMKLKFSTKAGTLKSLAGIIKSAQIAKICSFSVGNWNQDPESCLQEIVNTIGPPPWIVRSSCGLEDSVSQSNAGAFLSKMNVGSSELRSSVDEVINSYGRIEETDEVLVQPMLHGVVLSGVAFSHDPNTCSPYQSLTGLMVRIPLQLRVVTTAEYGIKQSHQVWNQTQFLAL